ncbi:MAG: tyrosine-protein phosphatase, partial [Chloroflexi bacterium]|nr:tyrosine-protein phosphatase [Chloroflexota bacterium]
REEMYAERLRQQGIDPEPVLRNTMLRESFIEGVLDLLDADFGGIERYLAALGITPDELRALRVSFVEPA